MKWEKLLRESSQTLSLRTKVRLKRDVDLYVDIKKSGVTLYCPPYKRSWEPIFLHYLCHIKALEDGWMSPIINFSLPARDKNHVKTKKTIISRKSLSLNLMSRSADSFFDFFVFREVVRVFGKRQLHRLIDGNVKLSADRALDGFKKINNITGFRYSSYVNAVDWFAMIYSVAAETSPKDCILIDNLWKRISASPRFKDVFPPLTARKINWIRKFYQKLGRQYPSLQDALSHPDDIHDAFAMYYSYLWSGLKLRVKLLEHYRRI